MGRSAREKKTLSLRGFRRLTSSAVTTEKNIYIITFHYTWNSNTRHKCKFRSEKKRISVYAYYVSEGLTSPGILIYIYIGFKTLFYVVRHLDSIASYLPTGLHLAFFRSWPSLYLPSSFSSGFLVLSFVSASTSMLFLVIFLLPFSEHGCTM